MKRKCPQCKKKFEVKGLGVKFRKYCSGSCKWKAYYYRHPDRSEARRLKSQHDNAAFVDSYKKHCRRCRNKDKRVLDFHHLGNKVMAVSQMRQAGWSKKKILKEIKKCEVLCANCHRIEHWEKQHGIFKKRTRSH